MPDCPDIQPPFARALHSMLGCSWGHDFVMNGDPVRCDQIAVQRIALHPVAGEPEHIVVRLCADHLAAMYAITDPTTQEDSDASDPAP
jgi:hypothetical protein